MTVATTRSFPVSVSKARAIWLAAQGLDVSSPFGHGPGAMQRATEHLGYVQIDTIHVIQRSHHHILYNRIPGYTPAALGQAQSVDKSVFEYWTHALAYVPTSDYRQMALMMARFRARPDPSLAGIADQDYSALLKRIRDEGPLTIRDIDDDVLIDKTHPWGSRKPSKRALRYGFFIGDLTISKRTGMVKTYELAARHFGWHRRPRPATHLQFAQYLLRRALRSQGIVSLDSICYGSAGSKAPIAALIESAVKRKRLVPVHVEGRPQNQHWIEPGALEARVGPRPAARVDILSPFDPLVIQRRRLELIFDYGHRFEAYVPAARRVLGYFALPVLVGDEIAAAIDLKMDRQAGKLLVRKWTWIGAERPGLKIAIDEALHEFDRFQRA